MGTFIIVLIVVILVVGGIAIAKTKTDILPNTPEEDNTAPSVNTESGDKAKDIKAANMSKQAERLREKASQIETYRWTVDILLVLSCIINIFAVCDMFRGGLCAAIVISLIIGAILAVYTVNIAATSKEELCKGQAEMLDLLNNK